MTLQLNVPDMACPKGYRFAYDACAKTITQAVLALDSTASVKADSKTKQVTVETQASLKSVREAHREADLFEIAAAGYNPA